MMLRTTEWLSVITVVYAIFSAVQSMPLPYTHSASDNYDNRLDTYFNDDVESYLMNFGYLPKSNIETGNLRHENQFMDAVKNLQRIGNLPVTGKLDVATRALMTKQRCGVPDTRDVPDFEANNLSVPGARFKRFVIKGAKWPNTNLTWSLMNQTMESPNSGQVRRVLHEAFNVWSKNSMLTFQEVHSDVADILVLFAKGDHGDGYKFDGPGSVLAHAFYPTNGDVHFDAEETWMTSPDDEKRNNGGTSLFGVAVHEIGHSLGLGHSSVQGAIMFPWYTSDETTNDLKEDDRIAIQQIYGSSEKQWGPINHPKAPRVTPPPTRRTQTYLPDTKRPRDREGPREWDRERARERERAERERKEWERAERERVERERVERERELEIEKQLERERAERERQQKIDRERNRNRHSPYNPDSRDPYVPRQPPTNPTRRLPVATQRTTPPSRTGHTHIHHHHPQNPHHGHRHPHRNKTKPLTCDTSYDAISRIHGELFIFKDRYLWRIGRNGQSPDGPYEINRMWSALPADFTHIDAVYENRDHQIVFFIGPKYYVFKSDKLQPGYPRPLTDLGLPPIVKKIDAALIWGHNNRTYLYSGTVYWRFDEDEKRVELDYPRDMSMWRGIGYHIDTAFQNTNGKTYFFKGKGFWEFDDYNMRVQHKHQKSSAEHFMNCEPSINDVDTKKNESLLSSKGYSITNTKHLLTSMAIFLAIATYYF